MWEDDLLSEVAPGALKEELHGEGEIAVLDVREFGQYGEGHLLFGVNCPYSRLESVIEALVPRKTTSLVLYDQDGGAVVQAAAARAADLGYRSIRVLAGGAEGWAASGLALFKGVNVPSKAFGELVEHAFEVPSLTPDDLEALRGAGKPVVVLDGRPIAEYAKTTIPGSICCPNGELAYRLDAIVSDRGATVVINCAGRTRSLVGAQILRSLGIANPVYALRNGTMGWQLSGRTVEAGADRLYPGPPAPERRADLRARAYRIASERGVPQADAATVLDWLDDNGRTTYLLDIRTQEEFADTSLTGAVHAPGGQLLQATDHWVAVRRARLVVVDNDGIRASVIAHWLRLMGWDAFFLAMEDIAETLVWSHAPGPPAAEAVLPVVPILSSADLAGLVRAGGIGIVDVRPGLRFRAGHLRDSVWAIRPRFEEIAARLAGKEIVIVAEEPITARASARDFEALGVRVRGLVLDPPHQWAGSGLETIATPHDPPDTACIDHLFFVHDRHEGNLESARRYLEWETGLLDQMDARELGSYRIAAPQRADAS